MTIVYGVAFQDLNGNGVYQVGVDTPVPNVLVEARAVGNPTPLASAVTDAAGNYSLTWPTQAVEVFVHPWPSAASGLIPFDPIGMTSTYVAPPGLDSGYAPWVMRPGVQKCRC
jgi:hypothetical protein